jgi:hypothetical protein
LIVTLSGCWIAVAPTFNVKLGDVPWTRIAVVPEPVSVPLQPNGATTNVPICAPAAIGSGQSIVVGGVKVQGAVGVNVMLVAAGELNVMVNVTFAAFAPVATNRLERSRRPDSLVGLFIRKTSFAFCVHL